MKVETKYVCEICHTVYNDKKDAEACEAGHKRIKKIADVHYNAIKVAGKYPSKVTILFDDGEKILYKR